MKKFTQIVKRKYLALLFFLFFATSFSQNAIVGTGFSTGWGGGGCPTGFADFKYLSAGAGTSYGVTTIANGTGDQFFRFGVDWSGTTAQLTKTIGSDDVVIPNTTYSLNTSCTTTGAMKYNVPNATYNYVFKTLNAGTNPTGTFVFFEVQGAVRNVTDVTQSPSATSVTDCHTTTITATLDGALSDGQGVYLRFSKDAWASSTVVAMTGSGTSYTGRIPSAFNSNGATVFYYLFTSGDTGVTPDGSNADLFTINLKNNAGPNYSYTVSSSVDLNTTFIPDNKFEQALIALGLDCTLDDSVFTSNISGLKELNIESLGITDLTGIEDFSSLQDLYCANNLIENLDVSMLTNLRYLDCQSNALISLDITGLNNLTQMVCWFNNLASLDLSSTPNLVYLDCDDNLFTDLDVSSLTKLNQFYCSDNVLTSLDVRGLTNLVNFECTGNFYLDCILVDDVAAAISASTTIDPSQDPYTFWAKDPDAKYSYCSNCNLTTTWNGSSWNPLAPTDGNYTAIISADYIGQPANINACSLTITNDASVVIPSGTNVTLNAPITVDAGSTFTLNSNANLIQTYKNLKNTGNISVNRDSSPLFRLDYTMWSSPVSGTQTLGGFSPLTTQTPTSRFYIYDNTLGTNGLYSSVSPTTTFATGKGYLIRMPDNWVAFGGTAASWPGNFTGTPNNGDITFTMSTALNGYNAVGNPYPSTINMDNFINENSANISGPLYFWRKTNDASNLTSYSTCTIAGCTSPNTDPYPNPDFISVGQGFIVKATSNTLNFNNTMRVANNTNQFFKTKVVEKNRIWLNLSNDTTPVNQMLIAYMLGASQGIDRTIDGAYFNDSAIALNSLIGNEEFAIQGRSLPFDGTDIVPLAFKTDTAGNFTIAIDHVDGLFSGSQDIILKDNTTGTETDLKAGTYTFTATAGTDNTRFSLKYQKTLKVDTLAFNENSVTVYKNKGTLIVNSGMVDMSNIKVFDIQGRLITEKKNMKTTTATINNLKSTNQVLIVKVTSQDNTVVSKKVVY